MEKREDPPVLGSYVRRSPYTPEGQIEQYGALSHARGWRRTAVKVGAAISILAFLLITFSNVFFAR